MGGMGGPGQVGFDAAGIYKSEREALGTIMMVFFVMMMMVMVMVMIIVLFI